MWSLRGVFPGQVTERGARPDPGKLQTEANQFRADLEHVYRASAVRARRVTRGRVLAHLENWSQLPLIHGGYTNNQPGYFTILDGLDAKPAGNIFFAGEYTDSIYSYQGFMEGALLSGARAAIGAQIAHPDKTAVCISGDASILMNIQELATARQRRTPVKVVLCNNGRMGMVRP